jgi:hypothetical protein
MNPAMYMFEPARTFLQDRDTPACVQTPKPIGISLMDDEAKGKPGADLNPRELCSRPYLLQKRTVITDAVKKRAYVPHSGHRLRPTSF